MTSASDLLDPIFGGERNLSMTERALYVAGGLGLAAAAATPRPNPLLNVLALAGGAYLVLSGYQGHCPVRAALSGGHEDASLGHEGRSSIGEGHRGSASSPRSNPASPGAHAS